MRFSYESLPRCTGSQRSLATALAKDMHNQLLGSRLCTVAVALLVTCLAAAVLGSSAQEVAPLTLLRDPLTNRALAAFQAGKIAAEAVPGKALQLTYLKMKPGSFIATSCQGLADLGGLFTATMADPTAKLSKFVIYLPCQAGSMNIRGKNLTWDRPQFNCLEGASTNTSKSIQAVFLTHSRAGSVTITAMTKAGGCVLPTAAKPTGGQLPALYGGARADPVETNYLTFGANTTVNGPAPQPLLTVVINGLNIVDNGLRGGIGAYYAKSLTLRNIRIVKTYSSFQGAALDIIDTSVSWIGTKGFDLVEGCKSINKGTLSPDVFPGGGGAIALRQATVAAPLTISNVKFDSNTHTNFGGVFGIYKIFNGPTKVVVKGCQFKYNRGGFQLPKGGLGGGAIGFTYRKDGCYSDASVPIPGKTMNVVFTSCTFSYNWGGSPGSGNLDLMMYGIYNNHTIRTPREVVMSMPIDTNQKTRVSPVFTPATDALPASPVTDTITEYQMFSAATQAQRAQEELLAASMGEALPFYQPQADTEGGSLLAPAEDQVLPQMHSNAAPQAAPLAAAQAASPTSTLEPSQEQGGPVSEK